MVLATGVVAVAQQSPRGGDPSQLSSKAAARLEISDVTVTASSSHGDSAVVMSLVNSTGGPISLMSVSSPLASMGMQFHDANMRQNDSTMTWQSDILTGSAATQHLGNQNDGVELSVLDADLKVGAHVPLEVTYSDFSTSRTITVNARVVAPPTGLHFNMSAMHM